jgi:EAL domain-containing protein (putative c-di-GMP-specific phosphodiesterase class I)
MNISPEKIIAYFQPILSADSKTVYSYEILGRYIDDNGAVQSLGPFFNDANTTNEEALQVDRLVRKYAMKKYAEEKRNEYLFINIRLAWLTQYTDKPELMVTLRLAEEFGIALEKLVIEITEEEFNASDAYLRAIVHYKSVGCRIALDDYGKSASDIERLAKLKPDIIKVNMDYIHNSEKSYHYREYLRSIANFAESVGIEVLYEGIETQRQLDICMSLKGRYYQGFLIAHPQPSMCDAAVNDAVFSASIENVYTVLQNEIVKTETLRKSLDAQVEHFLAENPLAHGKNDYDTYLTKLYRELSNARLVFLCDRHGNQFTSNIVQQSEDPVSCDSKCLAMYKNKNWVWRGYFYEALKSVAIGQKSCISPIYNDFATKDKVRTYSYAINDDVFLFVDIEEIFGGSYAKH